MRIAVTGGAGFIGSNLCEALLNRGDSVICIDDFNDFYDPKIKEKNIRNCLQDKNFFLYRADVREFNRLEEIFKKNKVDKIVHLAARAGVRNSIKEPLLYEEVNVGGTANLLELARRHNIKNFVLGSSSSVYGANKKIPFSENDDLNNMLSPYAVTKMAGELLCKFYHDAYGLNISCLRFFTVYGPRGRIDMAVHKFTRLINEGKEIPAYGSLESKRDYTYITDIINGILVSLDKNFGFEIINLGDSNPIELKYLISLIEKNIGKKAKIKKLSPQPGDVPITFADISKAERLLNYKPTIKIEEGIKLFAEWYKKCSA